MGFDVLSAPPGTKLRRMDTCRITLQVGPARARRKRAYRRKCPSSTFGLFFFLIFFFLSLRSRFLWSASEHHSNHMIIVVIAVIAVILAMSFITNCEPSHQNKRQLWLKAIGYWKLGGKKTPKLAQKR